VPEARRLAELSYEEMQELAEAGAKVLHAQAVEFAKEKGIALYCRATAGGDGETVVRRAAPSRAGGAVGVASEKGLLLLTTPLDALGVLGEILAYLDVRQAAGKELVLRPPTESSGGQASLVLSRENLHDLTSIIAELETRFGDIRLREGVGAVSAIGSGINASFANLRTTLDVTASVAATVLGVSTSSFRISVLVDEGHLPALTRALHRALVEPA
jgi:aspartate kinase